MYSFIIFITFGALVGIWLNRHSDFFDKLFGGFIGLVVAGFCGFFVLVWAGGLVPTQWILESEEVIIPIQTSVGPVDLLQQDGNYIFFTEDRQGIVKNSFDTSRVCLDACQPETSLGAEQTCRMYKHVFQNSTWYNWLLLYDCRYLLNLPQGRNPMHLSEKS